MSQATDDFQEKNSMTVPKCSKKKDEKSSGLQLGSHPETVEVDRFRLGSVWSAWRQSEYNLNNNFN